VLQAIQELANCFTELATKRDLCSQDNQEVLVIK